MRWLLLIAQTSRGGMSVVDNASVSYRHGGADMKG